MPFIMPGPNAPLPPRANAGGKARAQRWGAASLSSMGSLALTVLGGGGESEVSWGHPGMRRTCKHTRSAQGCGRLAAVGSHRLAE